MGVLKKKEIYYVFCKTKDNILSIINQVKLVLQSLFDKSLITFALVNNRDKKKKIGETLSHPSILISQSGLTLVRSIFSVHLQRGKTLQKWENFFAVAAALRRSLVLRRLAERIPATPQDSAQQWLLPRMLFLWRSGSSRGFETGTDRGLFGGRAAEAPTGSLSPGKLDRFLLFRIPPTSVNCTKHGATPCKAIICEFINL